MAPTALPVSMYEGNVYIKIRFAEKRSKTNMQSVNLRIWFGIIKSKRDSLDMTCLFLKVDVWFLKWTSIIRKNNYFKLRTGQNCPGVDFYNIAYLNLISVALTWCYTFYTKILVFGCTRKKIKFKDEDYFTFFKHSLINIFMQLCLVWYQRITVPQLEQEQYHFRINLFA